MSRSGKQILLLGNGRQSLTVIRSLAREGWAPIVGIKGDKDRNAQAHLARDVAGTWKHSDFQDSEFKNELLAFVAENKDCAAIYPVNGEAVRCMNALRDMLPHDMPLVLPNEAAVTACFDKDAMHKLCQKIGVPIAAYRIAHGRTELLSACNTIGQPCVVKPLDQADLVFGVKAAIVSDEATLSGWLQDSRLDGQRMMVQQYIGHPRYNAYFAAQDGRLLHAVAVLIHRTDRVDGTGFAVSGQTIEPPPILREDCEKLVHSLNYTGVGCAQWLMDPNSEERIFLELNPRLGGNFKVVEAAGVPLAHTALKLALEKKVVTPAGPWTYKRRVQYAWTIGALAGCRFELQTGAVNNLTAARLLSLTMWEALTAQAHLTWSWRDPIPTLAEMMRPLRKRPTLDRDKEGLRLLRNRIHIPSSRPSR